MSKIYKKASKTLRKASPAARLEMIAQLLEEGILSPEQLLEILNDHDPVKEQFDNDLKDILDE